MNWPTATLGDIAKIERNSIAAADIPSGSRYVGLEHIESGGGLLSFGEVTNGELASNKFQFGPRHILFGKLRPYLAKVICPNFEGICSTDILPIAPGKRIDQQYLLHFLRHPQTIDWASSRATGVNLPRLSPNELASLEIPLPPLDEQRRIATILDKADALRRRRIRALDLLESLTQSIFLDMFGEPLTNPKNWSNTECLGHLGQVVSGITKGRKSNGADMRSIPYLAVSNVQDKRLDLNVVKTIDATEDEIRRYRLEADDLLLTEGGDPDKLGRGTLWTNEFAEMIHQNHIFRVRVTSDKVLPLYLIWLLGSPYGKAYFLRSAKQTTGIASINKQQLSNFPVILPPTRLQSEFAVAANRVNRLAEEKAKAMSAAEALFSSVQHRAFSGQL